ncbi:MAG: SDR family oxidoreductase [Bdellovibrionales bacterium]
MTDVLVTGANRGIGLEFVRQYAAGGCEVIACARHPEKAGKLQELAGKHASIRIETLDVTDPSSVAALAAKLRDRPIDILINNAGIYSGAPGGAGANDDDKSQDFGSIDAEAWDRVLRVNTIAPIMVLQAFAPHLARGRDRKAVMITSRMGSIAEMGRGYIAYRTSKAALNAAMVTVSHELKAQKITVVNLHPGWVKTDMGGPNALIDPETSVAGMRAVIAGLAQTGQYLNYEGKPIAW